MSAPKLTPITSQGVTFGPDTQVKALISAGTLDSGFGYRRLAAWLMHHHPDKEEDPGSRAADRLIQKARRLGWIEAAGRRGNWRITDAGREALVQVQQGTPQ